MDYPTRSIRYKNIILADYVHYLVGAERIFSYIGNFKSYEVQRSSDGNKWSALF